MQILKKFLMVLFVFIVCLIPVYSTELKAETGYLGRASNGFATVWAGTAFDVNVSITIYSMHRGTFGTTPPTQCAIFDDSGVMLTNGSYDGNICEFDSPIFVEGTEGAETQISFVGNKNGEVWAGGADWVDGTPPLVMHTAVGNFIGYVYDEPEIVDGDNYVYEIIFFNYTLGAIPLPSTDAELKYFVDGVSYTNETFDEGEDFTVRLNLTYDDMESNASQCNITFMEGITEFEGITTPISICNSGCDFNNYSLKVDIPASNTKNDTLHINICHSQTVNGNLVIDTYCPTLIDTHTILKSEISSCSVGSTAFLIDIDGCETQSKINITLSNNVVLSQRHNVSKLDFDREYTQNTEIFSFNETSRFYDFSTHTFEYYKHGTKNIFVNCTNSTTSFNSSFNITIVNIPPVIAHPFIIIDNIMYPFTDLLQIFATSLSNITITETIISNDLKNHTTYLTNSTHTIWTMNTSTPVDFESTFISMGNFTLNDTYNWTTIADDGTDRINLTTRFIFNLTNNIAPVIVINTSIGFVFDTGNVRINYTPIDLQNMKNCTFNSNISGITADSFINYSIKANQMTYFQTSVNVGTFGYNIRCTDIFGLVGYSSNQTFIVTGEPSPYNVNLLKNTNWFNTEVLDLSTTAGVLLMFFIFALIVGLVVLSEVTGIGAMMSLSGIVIGFFGWLIYVSISVIIGIFIIILGLGYILRGVFNAT